VPHRRPEVNEPIVLGQQIDKDLARRAGRVADIAARLKARTQSPVTRFWVNLILRPRFVSVALGDRHGLPAAGELVARDVDVVWSAIDDHRAVGEDGDARFAPDCTAIELNALGGKCQRAAGRDRIQLDLDGSSGVGRGHHYDGAVAGRVEGVGDGCCACARCTCGPKFETDGRGNAVPTRTTPRRPALAAFDSSLKCQFYSWARTYDQI